MINYLLAVLDIILYLFFIKIILKNKYWFLSILFLLIIPWFVQLLMFGFEFWLPSTITLKPKLLLTNFINNSSIDYLFFQGDKRLAFGTQETGLLYIFQIPLIIIGFYSLVIRLNRYSKLLIFWFIGAFIIVGFFKSSLNFSNSLLYLLPLQLISFSGLIYILDKWSKISLITKLLVVFFMLISIYEIFIYFHILTVHYPKRLLLQ